MADQAGADQQVIQRVHLKKPSGKTGFLEARMEPLPFIMTQQNWLCGFFARRKAAQSKAGGFFGQALRRMSMDVIDKRWCQSGLPDQQVDLRSVMKAMKIELQDNIPG